MNDLLLASEMELVPSAEAVFKAEEAIKKLCGQQVLRRLVQNGGVSPQKSFESMDLQRSSFTNVEFLECDFTEAAATGVNWTNSKFIGCRFDRADFEYADLSGCQITPSFPDGAEGEQPCSIVGAGFNGVQFRGGHLWNLRTMGSSFAHADFTGAKIFDTKFDGTFEGCIFKNAEFERVSFRSCNIEYADFADAQFEETEIEILDLPYVFGIRSDQIGAGLNVVAVNQDTGNHETISWEKLIELKSRLVDFHTSRHQYFACANLALLFQDFPLLKASIQEGLNLAWEAEDYRSLKFLCKLISVTDDQTGAFGRSVLQKFYDLIVEKVGRSGNEAIRNQYELHDGQIRSMLLHERPDTFQIYFQSTTENPHKAGNIAARVVQLIEDSYAAAGFNVTIVASRFSFNSNSTHVVEVRVNNVDQKVYLGAKSAPPWNAPTIITVFCSVASLLIAGAQAAETLFDSQKVPPPAPVVQQTIINKHIDLNVLVLPESFCIRKKGIPLTGWAGGRVVLYENEFDAVQLVQAANELGID